MATQNEATKITQADWDRAQAETQRLCENLNIANADHIALWLEANLTGDTPIAYLACRIIEAHEAAITQAEARARVEALKEATAALDKMKVEASALGQPDAVFWIVQAKREVLALIPGEPS